jgi:hypothetical protein
MVAPRKSEALDLVLKQSQPALNPPCRAKSEAGLLFGLFAGRDAFRL